MNDNEKLIEELRTTPATGPASRFLLDRAAAALEDAEKVRTPTDDGRDAREAAWQEYRSKMFELDAQNNLAGRGLIPSHRDWHAGWDAHAARRVAQGEPSDTPTMQVVARRGGKSQALIESLLAQANERGIRVEVVYPQGEPSDAIRAALAVLESHEPGEHDHLERIYRAGNILRAAVTEQGENR